MPSPARLVLAFLLACMLLAPSHAAASESQLSMMMDDDLLVYRDDATRDASLRRMKSLGVDVVRVTVLWSTVAEDARKTPALDKRFRKLGADNPKAYPTKVWDRYDRLVRAVNTLGMQLYFNVTGPGPAYGHEKPPAKYKKDAKWWKPKPREYYKFVQAVGKRYSGQYKDENDGRGTIGRVAFWSLWNEPNQGGWLRPQWLNGKPVSPQLYRDLYQFGRRALVSTGHGNDIILVGETAPRAVARKTTTSAMGPRTFINELLCAPGHLGAGCESFAKSGPIVATAFAHHPYTRSLAPNVPEANPDAITLANIGDLGTLLDTLSATGNIRSGMPIMSTEFGYETKPPDPFAGVTEAQQADYISLSEALTYFNPRIVANTQFLLRDVAPLAKYKKGGRNYWSTYQSGLYTLKDVPKPAAQAYAMPFTTFPAPADPATGAAQVSAFGQIRFRENVKPGGTPDPIQFDYQPPGATTWTQFATTTTNALGYFVTTLPYPGPGLIRARWNGAQQPFQFTSRPRGI